jgi:hypothetical protein
MKLAVLALLPGLAWAQAPVEKTVVNDKQEYALLLGEHAFTLQWIGWDRPGKVVIEERDGILFVEGKQEVKKSEDYIRIQGKITEVNRRSFKFEGTIEYRVSYNNQGQPCLREGPMDFIRRGKRRYWRLKQMDNPCERPLTDYIDIFVRPKAKKK